MEDKLSRIRELMQSQPTLPLYACDYQPIEADYPDLDGEGEYRIYSRDNWSGTEYWNAYIRKVTLEGSTLYFDVDETYENAKGTYETTATHEHLDFSELNGDPELIDSVLSNIIYMLENKEYISFISSL